MKFNLPMKKISVSLLIGVITCYYNSVYAVSMETMNQDPNWMGFYVGGNVGYWKSQNNKVVTTGSPNFINQTFPLGAENIANALAQLATNSFYMDSSGFLGGVLAGYNYQYSNGVLLGLDTSFNGATNQDNAYSLQKVTYLTDFEERYLGALNVKQKMNYLGAVRARFGYLAQPTLLFYASIGFAYANVSLETNWTAQESLGAPDFPTIVTQNKSNKTLQGWTAGAGVEWLFKPNWSAGLEYSYYNLNSLNNTVELAQINGALSPPATWGTAIAKTNLSLSLGTLKVAINYHFA